MGFLEETLLFLFFPDHHIKTAPAADKQQRGMLQGLLFYQIHFRALQF